jgi:hypothetical protein
MFKIRHYSLFVGHIKKKSKTLNAFIPYKAIRLRSEKIVAVRKAKYFQKTFKQI